MGWQWHQLDHIQIICTSLQTHNHASTSPLSFYRPDALPAVQPTASKRLYSQWWWWWWQSWWCPWRCVAETMSMESAWSLALVVKSVVMATADGDCVVSLLLRQLQFVECVSYLAQLGTDLSRKWTVEDLEVCWLSNTSNGTHMTTNNGKRSLFV